jgi:DNA mismatch repair ATPase MutL
LGARRTTVGVTHSQTEAQHRQLQQPHTPNQQPTNHNQPTTNNHDNNNNNQHPNQPTNQHNSNSKPPHTPPPPPTTTTTINTPTYNQPQRQRQPRHAPSDERTTPSTMDRERECVIISRDLVYFWCAIPCSRYECIRSLHLRKILADTKDSIEHVEWRPLTNPRWKRERACVPTQPRHVSYMTNCRCVIRNT